MARQRKFSPERKSEFEPQIDKKNRGVLDILIVSVDGLTGFGDAISAVFSKTEIQRCIVRQIRYTTKFVSYKDVNAFITDLKHIYQASTEDAALSALDTLEEKWGENSRDWNQILAQLCIISTPSDIL